MQSFRRRGVSVYQRSESSSYINVAWTRTDFFSSTVNFSSHFLLFIIINQTKSNKVKAKDAMNTHTLFWLRPPTVTIIQPSKIHTPTLFLPHSSTLSVSSLRFSLHHSHFFFTSSAIFLFPLPIPSPLHSVLLISASLFVTDQLVGLKIGFTMPFSFSVNSDSIAWVVLLEVVFLLTDSSSSFATGVGFHCGRFFTLIQSGLGDREWVVRNSLELWGE